MLERLDVIEKKYEELQKELADQKYMDIWIKWELFLKKQVT